VRRSDDLVQRPLGLLGDHSHQPFRVLTLCRKLSEYRFGIAWTLKRRINATRFAHRRLRLVRCVKKPPYHALTY
jgi:hypothetical protein